MSIPENKNFDSYSINETEKNFIGYFEKTSISVLYIHQSPNSFPKILKQLDCRRPDFLLKCDVGEILVDIKTSKLKYYTKYTLSVEDFNKLRNTEKLLKKHVYIAFPIDCWGKGLDWGFISIKRIKKLKEKQQKFIEDGQKFIGIEYSELKRYFELL